MRSQLQFNNRLIAQISCGFRTPFRETLHIVGDKGSLQVVEPWKPGIKGVESRAVFTPVSGAEVSIVTPAIDPYLCEVQAMEACILDGVAPVLPLSRSRHFLQSALAIYTSAKTGEPVRL
jgi:predicted dehydrogenase